MRDLEQKLRSGELSPDAAIAEYEKDPTKALTSIPADKLVTTTLDCGFPSLNECDVLVKGEGSLILVEARPGMGKSAFIFQIAAYVARTKNVLLFSEEMSHRSILMRMVAQETGLGLKRIKRGEAPADAVAKAYERLSKLKLRIDDRAALDVRTLCATALQRHKKENISLIVADYLQIIPGNPRLDRHKEVGDVAKELRELGNQIGCPVLTGAQVNRECLRRGFEMLRRGDEPDFMPAQGELSESDKADFHADVIIGLTREEVITGKREGLADIQILKHRSGELGRFTFKFLGASTRFVDSRSKEEELV